MKTLIMKTFTKLIAVIAVVFAFSNSIVHAQDSYTLSAGDEVSIVVFGQPDLSVTANLDENGLLSYPLLGSVNAAGLSVSELERTLTSELSGSYLVNPSVTVTVAAYRQVFINGEVNRPGGFDYKPGLTLDKAIALAGGFAEKASKERITLTREINGQPRLFSMRPTDTVLPGDIIEVAEYLQIFVNGEVQRPGDYVYQQGLTVEKTISLAGGFSARASKKRIRVSREVDGQQQTGRIRMSDPVYPGDILSVPQGFF